MEPVDYGSLLRSIMANINSFIGGRSKVFGIKQGQFEYFLMIFSKPGINQRELGQMKGVGKASVTRALIALEDEGFIRRETDSEDRRIIRCYVTDKGTAITEELFAVKIETEKQIFKGFSEEEKQMLYRLLSRLQKNTEELKES